MGGATVHVGGATVGGGGATSCVGGATALTTWLPVMEPFEMEQIRSFPKGNVEVPV